MKFTKLSLAAIVAMGLASSASAVENVKVDGQIKLWYQTTDAKNSADQSIGTTDSTEADGLFKKDGATGDLVAKLRATGDLTKKVGFGVTMYAATSMGLEANLVGAEAINDTSSNGLNGTDKNPIWLGEAYFTYKMGKTIAKIGRQELDTPLAYSEHWNAAPNTFEAAVLVNQDVPNLTLVGAYVARGNGLATSAGATSTTNTGLKVIGANAGTINTGGTFSNYHTLLSTGGTGMEADKGGAYAAGAVYTGVPYLTIHPVYYNVLDTATAVWTDVTFNMPKIVKVEALYANVDPTGVTQDFLDGIQAAASNKSTTAYGAQVSGEVVGLKLAAAYSNVGKGFMPVANTATGFKKTKIYTASIICDGTVAGRPDTTGWKLSAGYDIAGFNLGASYASYKVGKNDDKANWFNASSTLNAAGDATYSSIYTGAPRGVEFSPSEIDLSVSTKIDEVNLALYYVNVKEIVKSANTNGFTRDLQAIRAIATINF